MPTLAFDTVTAPHESIRTKERVRKLGEVFTPPNIVNDMIDMVEKAAVSNGRPLVYNSTFFEPACGPRGFLVETLRRKLALVEGIGEVADAIGKQNFSPYEYKSLIALGSIYGEDIDALNVRECRTNLKNLFLQNYNRLAFFDSPQSYIEASEYILKNNIFRADFLNNIEMGKVDIIEYLEAGNFEIERRFYKFTDLYPKEKKDRDLFDEYNYSGDRPRRIMAPCHYSLLSRGV